MTNFSFILVVLFLLFDSFLMIKEQALNSTPLTPPTISRTLGAAVVGAFSSATGVQSAKGAIWFLALFYAVSPAEHDQQVTFGSAYTAWEIARRYCLSVKCEA